MYKSGFSHADLTIYIYTSDRHITIVVDIIMASIIIMAILLQCDIISLDAHIVIYKNKLTNY